MPEWMAEITLGTIVAAVAGALLVGGLFVKVWKPIKKVSDSFAGLMAGWNGTPEGRDASGAVIHPAVPGVLAQMAGMSDNLSGLAAQLGELKEQVATIHHETTPNHGGSMNDAVKRVEKKLNEHIEIAVKSDERQEATGAIVDKYLPLLERLEGEESP